jgi:hypothetical protein
VKRYSGDDSWGVAPCENSSLPGLILKSGKPLDNEYLRAFCCGFNVWSNAESSLRSASPNYELLGYLAAIQLDPLPISTTNGTANSTAFSIVRAIKG